MSATVKKHLVIRRAINQRLAATDRAHRCVFCRRQLPIGYLIYLTPSGEELRYCDGECRADHAEKQFLMETR